MNKFEEYDRTLDEATSKIGPAIRELGQKQGFSLVELKSALTVAMETHGFLYSEETINGFLYKKGWPPMTRDTAISIVIEAFGEILKKKKRQDETPAISKKIASMIKKICRESEHESVESALDKVNIEFFTTSIDPKIALFVGKNLAAFSSLTEGDILFWSTLTTWSDEKRKKTYDSWRKSKADYQTIISSAFQQWIALRSKDYSDSARKPRKEENLRPSKKFLSQIQRLSSDEAKSVRYILGRLQKRSGSAEGRKYPLAPPIELDLLILFKYCLPEEERKQYIERIQKEQQKAAGDD